MSGPSSIVIRGTNWLGDAVLTIPSVRALRRVHPSARLVMVAPRNLAELWESEGSCDRVIPFDRPVSFGERLRVIRALRAERFELGVLFPNSFESALWFLLGGVRERAGFAVRGRSILLTRRIREPRGGGHQVRRYLALAAAVGGADAAEEAPSLRVPERFRVWADGALRRLGIAPGMPLVGIAPGSAYGSAKCWPEERYASLIRLLRERGDVAAVILGSTAEAGIAGRLSGGWARSLAGATSVMQLAAVLERCAAFAGNDSGTMHLACAVGTPAVVIVGPTEPGETGPLGRSEVVRGRAECAPCFKRVCPTDHRCMTAVAAEDVAGAVARFLAERGTG